MPDRCRTPKFVSCSKLGSGRAVLVGDAAHAVSPNVAAGCNAGLQDGAVLAEAVKAAGGDLDAVADLYSAARLEDAQVLLLLPPLPQQLPCMCGQRK